MTWIDWYNSLAKPAWTPAPATIGLIWQILYPIILVSFGFVFVQAIRRKVAVAGGPAVRHQPRGEPDLHADPVRDAEPAAGVGGHPDRVGHDHLDDGRRLAALPLGRRGPGSVFRLGVAGDRAATVDHGDELGAADDGAASLHPAQRFIAPSAIQHGVPLKELMDRKLVALIGQSLAEVVPGFDVRRFQARAVRDLDKLELKERALSIAHAMAEQMPVGSSMKLSPLLIKSFGPPLEQTEGNGLAPFFYFPHTHLIAAYGVSSFDSGMAANYEITKRFTAEFSIRPFLIEHRSKCLKVAEALGEGRQCPRSPSRERRDSATAALGDAAAGVSGRPPNLSLPLLELLKDDPNCMCGGRSPTTWATSPRITWKWPWMSARSGCKN